LVAE
jgi:hypothetical protein